MIAAPFVSRAIMYTAFAAALLGALGMHNTHAMAGVTMGAQAAPASQPLHANI